MEHIYHAGELSMQKWANASAVAEQNVRSIQSVLTKGAMGFLQKQTLVIATTADKAGRVWTSYLSGEPGFLTALNDKTLTVASDLQQSDPLYVHLESNPEIGLLVIDLERRFRLRINGRGTYEEGGRLIVTTEQVYGNCPKYIQKRILRPHVYQRNERRQQHGVCLAPEHKEWIGRADTFFIGSSSADGKLDASHRGGMPGFVQIVHEKELIFPDYFGNSMFNTLGNIISNPRTGLLFIDFDTGDSLQLTGNAVVIHDNQQISSFPGAERLVQFRIDELLYTENSVRISWELAAYSPANPAAVRKGGGAG